jgi:hypothetical protein
MKCLSLTKNNAKTRQPIRCAPENLVDRLGKQPREFAADRLACGD